MRNFLNLKSRGTTPNRRQTHKATTRTGTLRTAWKLYNWTLLWIWNRIQ